MRTTGILGAVALCCIGLTVVGTLSLGSSLETKTTFPNPWNVSLPPTNGAWLVMFEMGGGDPFPLNGAVAVNSRGEIVTSRCAATLTASDQEKLEALVRTGKPELWPNLVGGGIPITAGTYALRLTRRGLSGVEEYSTTWMGPVERCSRKPDSRWCRADLPRLPHDLIAIRDAIPLAIFEECTEKHRSK
jgi:hypothetical protein